LTAKFIEVLKNVKLEYVIYSLKMWIKSITE